MSERNDTMQRIQVGVVGLVAVLLLVSVGNYVSSKASDEESAIADILAEAGDTVDGIPEEEALAEPLAELGMTPAPEPEEEKPKATAPNAGAKSQTVPDLKPDPKLEAPMDQEPR